MSYLFGGRSRPWSTQFHVRRMRKEGFSKPYYQPTPEWQLVKSLLAYPIRKMDFYYMNVREYTHILLACTRDVAEEKGWDLVRDVTFLARKEGLIKDPPLVVAQTYPDGNWIADLLYEYPITKIELYIDLARKLRDEFGWSWGRKKKGAIAYVLNSKLPHWHELQAVKYRSSFRNVLRVVHPKPERVDVEKVWKWVVGKGEPPTDFIEVADKVMHGKLSGDEAVSEALRVGLPWEVIRSHIKLDNIDPDLLHEVGIKLWSGNDVTTQFITLLRRVGKDKALDVVRRKKDVVPLAQVSKTIVGVLSSSRYPREEREAVKELEKVFSDRFAEVRKTIIEPVGKRRAVALIDASASMYGNRMYAVSRMLAPMYKAIDRFFIFNDSYPDFVREVTIGDIEDVVGLQALPSGGTPLWEAIEKVAPEARKEDAVLLIFTDEQENVSNTSPQEVEKALKDVPTVVINPTPYPTDFIPKENVNVVGLAGADINAVLAGLRIIKINKIKQTEGKVDVSKLENLPTI